MSTGVVSPLIPSRNYILLSQAGFVPLPSPGICTISKAGRPLKFDEQEGYGMDGGRLTLIGVKFVHFEIKFEIWLDEHWVQWELFETLLEPPPAIPGGVALTLGIDHPILKNLGITKVYVEDPGQWEAGSTGLWSRTVQFIKWVRGRDRLLASREGPPATATVAVALTPQQKMNAALDAENASLRATAGKI